MFLNIGFSLKKKRYFESIFVFVKVDCKTKN